MSNILTVGFSGEGGSDHLFLPGVIQRTFETVAFDCESDIDVYPLIHLQSPHLGTAIENYTNLAIEACNRGLQVLCIHTDADDDSDEDALRHRINPAFNQIMKMQGGVCKVLVPIIPVHMIEAWMLADKELLKREIGTNLSDQDLGIARNPEKIADPKQVVIDAIRIAQQELPPKRRQLKIEALYQPLGQTVSLEALRRIDSYKKFELAVKSALVKLNYLRK